MSGADLRRLIVCWGVALLAACSGGSGDRANPVPVVNAGPDQSVSSGRTVTLQSFATDDGDIVSYHWSQFSGSAVALFDADQPTASFVAPLVEGIAVLVFRLDVTDERGAVASDGVFVNITGPDIRIDAALPIAPLRATQFGINGDPFTRTGGTPLVDAYRSAAPRLLRWPGGYADGYHWQTGQHCQLGPTQESFDEFVSGVAQPLAAELMINVAYGSNPACDGPADPDEAAQWVDYANNQKHYGVRYWAVGNELYFESSYDLHDSPRDPRIYAAAVAKEFYPKMKAQDPDIQVGVVVSGDTTSVPDWNEVVLATAKYDFVEMHLYPQEAGKENDAILLGSAVDQFPAGFAKLRAELAAAGRAGTPIFLAEFNSVNTNPGKQTLSIVNALFIGLAYAESLKAGIDLIAPHLGPTAVCFRGNNSPMLYGFQDYGNYGSFSAGPPTFLSPAPGECEVPAAGTAFPFGRALQLIAAFAAPGENLLEATRLSAPASVRAYAATRGSGYSVLLFNLDRDKPVTFSIGLRNAAGTAYSASLLTYDKAIYAQSATGLWLPPVTQALGEFNTQIEITLSPWSINVLTLQ